MLSSVKFLKSAYKKNADFHKALLEKHERIGKGSFLDVYYDRENDRVLKVFKLSVLKDPKHSVVISNEPEELFYSVFSNIPDDIDLLTQELLTYIFKTNYDWGIYCRDNHHNNIHLPVVYSVDIYPEYYTYVLTCERLFTNKHLKDKKLSWFLNKYCEHLNTFFETADSSIQEIFKSDNLPIKLLDKYNYLFDHPDIDNLFSDLKIKFLNFKPDLHIGNLLFRINKNEVKVIFSDPFY